MGKKAAALRAATEIDYAHKLDENTMMWLKKFEGEWHNGEAKYDDPTKLLQSQEAIKEANRNNKMIYQDAYNVATNVNGLREYTKSEKEIMELASDEQEYELVYKQLGPDYAREVVFKQAEIHIKAGHDIITVLCRFYVKMSNIKRSENEEKRSTRRLKNAKSTQE